MGHSDGDAGREQQPAVRIGDVHGSAFSIGGTHHSNTVHHAAGTGGQPPGAGELLDAVRDLRAALVRLPRGPERAALDGELDAVAGELEAAAPDGEVRPGLPERLRGALERWAPLVDSVSAATALAALLTPLGG